MVQSGMRHTMRYKLEYIFMIYECEKAYYYAHLTGFVTDELQATKASSA